MWFVSVVSPTFGCRENPTKMDYLINLMRGREGYIALAVLLLLASIGAWLERKETKGPQ